MGSLGSLVHRGLWEEFAEPTHQADAKQFQLGTQDHERDLRYLYDGDYRGCNFRLN